MSDRREPIRLGLLGLGTVGAAVAEIIHRDRVRLQERVGAPLVVKRAVVRNLDRKRSAATKKIELSTDPQTILSAPDIDIVVELAGGVEPAREWLTIAMAAGKPVVTANKAVLARHGARLNAASKKHRAGLYYEGAVAGGIPIIKTLRDSLASDRIRAVRGVLNGTTNFILGKMESGMRYGEALKEAQDLGYAEADPTLDVNGGDAADKLTILMQLAFGVDLPRKKLFVEGIEALTPDVLADADRLGYRVKLVATGCLRGKSQVEARVHPAFIRKGTSLAAIPGALNAVAIDSLNLGQTLYEGPGAGGFPTGNAVVADVIEAARNSRAGVVPAGMPQNDKLELAAIGETESAFYLRFLVADRPGVLTSITQALAEHGVSLETVLQRERGAEGKGPVPVVVTTFPCPTYAIQGATKTLRKQRGAIKALQSIRIEAE